LAGGITHENTRVDIDGDPVAVLDTMIMITAVRAGRDYLDFPWKIEYGRNKMLR